MRPVESSKEAKKIGNELVNLGFTDNLVLGKAAALELQLRLQDICNGFEPVKQDINSPVTYRSFKENPKVDALIELLEEINVEKNQVVVWSSRKLLIGACTDAFAHNGISYVVYDGDTKDSDKKEAEEKFKKREAQVFIANQASGAYGLNCLADCSYLVWLCIDGSVEKYYQALHRILRGQLHAPKFAYVIHARGTLEERQWEKIRIGQELIGSENRKEIFEFK
jgi:SNF2 family DNA or RNA helicase